LRCFRIFRLLWVFFYSVPCNSVNLVILGFMSYM
jgi:hypothetical protein